MRTLGTAACPPYHIAFVIGGTSAAEADTKTVKLASAKYYDALPTEGDRHGQAFRDIELERGICLRRKILAGARSSAANISLRYSCHPIAAPRASCPVGMGVSAPRIETAKADQPGRGSGSKLGAIPGKYIPEGAAPGGRGRGRCALILTVP